MVSERRDSNIWRIQIFELFRHFFSRIEKCILLIKKELSIYKKIGMKFAYMVFFYIVYNVLYYK